MLHLFENETQGIAGRVRERERERESACRSSGGAVYVSYCMNVQYVKLCTEIMGAMVATTHSGDHKSGDGKIQLALLCY